MGLVEECLVLMIKLQSLSLYMPYNIWNLDHGLNTFPLTILVLYYTNDQQLFVLPYQDDDSMNNDIRCRKSWICEDAMWGKDCKLEERKIGHEIP